EYREHLQGLAKNKNLAPDDPAIAASIKLGDRLSKWIAKINASRPADAAIRLTSPQTRRGIPIETPSIYSPSIIKTGAEKILAELPEAMKSVITSTIDLPATTGIDDETFIKHARLLDRNYQSAARYKSVNSYRMQYISMAKADVRGYYYLTQNKITAQELKEVATIEADKVAPIKDALTKICLNSNGDTLAGCKKKVDTAFTKNTLAAIYNKYFPAAQKNWNDFFLIPSSGTRSDVLWSNNIMTVPFNTPSIPKFVPYLQNNIEDEFRFGDWKLKMNFGTFSNGPLLVFKPGVVPHVNGLGGNQIVMDSNQPIEEYESQWTIRHEFGHVLGLPDCYHEFYDTNLEAYVNYQLDITDLMCSRAGNMKERIYTELKKAYGN
ncbi:MAG: hypothetical protein H0V66_15840, partial [Bdellovibrionales bacterium]|nr:hypothetical protein [Bdellovibrionales bacterium]